MTDEQLRVRDLIQTAFHGVRLGNGVGLRQGEGLDDYADDATLAALSTQDEKEDWSVILVDDLNRYSCSPSYSDAEGMRFHLPAYMIAHLEGTLETDIVFHLTYVGPGVSFRFELLSTEQRHVVREFLLLQRADPMREFERPLIEEALRQYWET